MIRIRCALRVLLACGALLYAAGVEEVCKAQLIVTGSLGYDSASGTGFKDSNIFGFPGAAVNSSGTAIGFANKYVSNTSLGISAFRWDGSGHELAELDSLQTSSSGVSVTAPYAVNESNTVVGFSQVYNSSGAAERRAVRWNADSTAIVELGDLGTDSSGVAYAEAWAINSSGTAAGYSDKYVSGIDKGERAVRWSATGTVATELGTLGTDGSGKTIAQALAINSSGTTVGTALKYVSGVNKNYRAVRWNASGTAATELGNLGLSSTGITSGEANSINSLGTVVGFVERFDAGADKGERAVRWDAAGTAATELPNLGTGADGKTTAVAYSINDDGTIVGYAQKFVAGVDQGQRAVRWDPSGAVAELGNFGTDANGSTNADAIAIDANGVAVGYAKKYVNGIFAHNSAALWLPDGTAIDLNDLGVVSSSGSGTWILTNASAVANNGWIAGIGTFTPTTGAAYQRNWVAQVGVGGQWIATRSGTLEGRWSDGRQWSSGTPAMQVGDATFNANAIYAVDVDRDETTRSVSVGAGNVTLDLQGHTLTSLHDIDVAEVAHLSINGSGAAEINGNFTNKGEVELGADVSAHVAGDFTLSNAGKLVLQIASSDSFSQIDVTGNPNLAGTLEVLFADGYLPSAGTSFKVFGLASHAGNFASLILPMLDESLSWQTTNLYTTGIISVGIAGDFNADGVVDTGDYVTWRDTIGTLQQYSQWRDNFGKRLASGSSMEVDALSGARVPEPSATILAISCLILGLARLRSRP